MVIYLSKIMRTLYKASLVVTIGIVVYYVRSLWREPAADGGGSERVYRAADLALRDGASRPQLYLALLGRVFDVSSGAAHYAPGASYHAFVGADRSRWFVTGPDDPQSAAAADAHRVDDLSCSDLLVLHKWLDTYFTKYTYKGKLEGWYYDASGAETSAGRRVRDKLAACEAAPASGARPHPHPACNVEWTPDVGTRVWCSPNSGGAARSWAGVPRGWWGGGQAAPECVCVRDPADADARLRPYPDCAPTAAQCYLADPDRVP